MSEYAQDAADALVSIVEAGRKAVLRRFSKTVSGTGAVSSPTVALGGLLDLVVLPVSKSDPFDDSLSEAFVQGRLRKLLIAAASAPGQPLSNDTILFEGAYWQVHGSTPLKPADVPIIYTAIVEDTDLSAADIAALNLSAAEVLAAA